MINQGMRETKDIQGMVEIINRSWSSPDLTKIQEIEIPLSKTQMEELSIKTLQREIEMSNRDKMIIQTEGIITITEMKMRETEDSKRER